MTVAEGAIPPDDSLYNIVSTTPNGYGGTESVIRLQAGISMREAINHLNSNYTLTGFQEILPTMNEIFIETVTGIKQ